MLLVVTLFVLLFHIATPNIISNIPTIVTSTKNYTSAAPTWLTSPFFRAGQEDVITTKTGSSQFPFSSYTFTFSSALPGTPNLAYGIQRYRGDDYLAQEYYEIRETGRTAATFSVQIQIFGVTNLWILAVAYLAVDPTFPHHLNSFDNVPINYTAGDIINITSQVDDLTYYVNEINYTQQASGRQFNSFTAPFERNHIVIFMTSLWINGKFGWPLQFHIYPQVINETHYLWNITLWTRVKVSNVHFSQIIFNSDDVQSSGAYYIVYEKWYTDSNGGFLQIPIQFVDNFIMGVTSFENTNARCGFEYQWQFVNQTINGTSTFGVEILQSIMIKGDCGFDWGESSILYMMTWQCDPPYIFFNITSKLCQTDCGAFTVANPTTGTCEACTNSFCYQCDLGGFDNCTDCANYLGRILVDGQCICEVNFMAANSQCYPCSYADAWCVNCTYEDDGVNGTLPFNQSLYTCSFCNDTANYFLNGTVCQMCTPTNCSVCDNLTACLICQSGFQLSAVLQCFVCNITGCLNCSIYQITNCTNCDESIGYYNDSITGQCSSICGDGIVVLAEQGCDDNNTINLDGCSANCTIQLGFGCSGSPSACYYDPNPGFGNSNQTIMNESITCNTITMEFMLSPAALVLEEPYILWDDFLSSPNQSLLWLNSSLTSYSGGILSLSYFMLGDLQNQTLIFDTNFSALLPNSTIFDNSSDTSLSVFVTTQPSALMQCCTGYSVNTATASCDQICGDGLVFDHPCDDGNLVNGDGCSSTCQIQTDYACINGSQTSASVCSFNGTISLGFISGDKDPNSNSMTLTYSLDPTYPLTALNNNSLDLTSWISFPGSSGVTVTSATIDPLTNQLVIEIGYSQDIQGTQLSLQITPPDVPQAFLIPNMTSTWTVDPTNQLKAVVYSNDEYERSGQIQTVANLINGLFLATMFITMVYRKFIGLELATLIQMGYLSLLHNKQITLYLQPITNWRYVFGYNNHYFSPQPSQRFMSPHNIYHYEQDFGFSNNTMIIVTAGVYLIALVFLGFSASATKEGTISRLRYVAFIIANDICYFLVVFLTPNILTAIGLEIRSGIFLNWSLPWSKGFLIASVGLFILAHTVCICKIEDSSDLGTFFNKDLRTGVYLPIIFNIRLLSISLFIFLYHSSQKIPTYLIIMFQVAYLLFVIIGRPHLKCLDLFRSLCIEVGLLAIFVMRVVEINLLAGQKDPRGSWFPLFAYIEYGIYLVCIVLSLTSMVYHLCTKTEEVKVQNYEESLQKIEKNSDLTFNETNQFSTQFNNTKFSLEELKQKYDEAEVTRKYSVSPSKNRGNTRYSRNRRFRN